MDSAVVLKSIGYKSTEYVDLLFNRTYVGYGRLNAY